RSGAVPRGILSGSLHPGRPDGRMLNVRLNIIELMINFGSAVLYKFMKTKHIIKPAAIASVCLLTILGISTARAADAKELWEKNCASCHGKDGKGDTKMGQKAGVKDYTDAKFQAEYNEEK